MVSGVNVSEKADKITPKKQTQTKMGESESIKEVVNQLAIQAAKAVIMAFRDADAGPPPTPNTKPERKPQRQSHVESVLKRP